MSQMGQDLNCFWNGAQGRKHGMQKLSESAMSKKKRKQRVPGEEIVILDRWEPQIQTIMEQWCQDELPMDEYPFVKQPPAEELTQRSAGSVVFDAVPSSCLYTPL